MYRLFAFLLLLTSCSQTNLLTYRYRKFYKEACHIEQGQPFTLSHEVNYDPPRVIDAYFSHTLRIILKDTAAVMAKRRIDVATDTNLVRVSYGVFSVWNWDERDHRITGEIWIKNWSNNKVKIKENLTIFDDARNRVRKFKGTRVFRLPP